MKNMAYYYENVVCHGMAALIHEKHWKRSAGCGTDASHQKEDSYVAGIREQGEWEEYCGVQ